MIVVLCYVGRKAVPSFEDREAPRFIRDATDGATRQRGEPQNRQIDVADADGHNAIPVSGAVTKVALPDWVKRPSFAAGNGTELVLLTSKQYATESEADQELEQAASLRVKEYFHRQYPHKGAWTLPANLVDLSNQALFPKQFIEPVELQTGTHKFRVVRVHTLLSLTPAMRAELYPSGGNRSYRNACGAWDP